MISAPIGERTILDEFEPQLLKRGYRLVREPSVDQLPDFLRGVRPDAIAVGANPSLLIEVLRSHGGSSATRVRQLRSLLSGHDDWRLEVLYLSPGGTQVTIVTLETIQDALQQARALAGREPRAGLLLAWSTLEAVVRTLEPSRTLGSLSSGSLLDLLVSNGHLSQSDSAELRALGKTRNALAHGQIDVSPAPTDVHRLIDIANGLLGEVKS